MTITLRGVSNAHMVFGKRDTLRQRGRSGFSELNTEDNCVYSTLSRSSGEPENVL